MQSGVDAVVVVFEEFVETGVEAGVVQTAFGLGDVHVGERLQGVCNHAVIVERLVGFGFQQVDA